MTLYVLKMASKLTAGDLCEELNQEAGLKCLIASLPPWTYMDIFTFSTTWRATLQAYSMQKASYTPPKSFHKKVFTLKIIMFFKMRAFEPLGAFGDPKLKDI